MSSLSFQSEVCRVDGAMNPHGIPVPDSVSEPLREMGVAEGDSVAVEIEPDPEPDRVDVCDELLIALEQDFEAKERWDSFTPGKQRSIELYVSGAKREETRIKRAVDIVEKIRTRTLHGD